MNKGRINIARVSSNVEPYHQFRIEVIDDKSRVHFLEVRMSTEEFALAISGCGERPCEFELRNVNTVGHKRESKDEIVAIPADVRASRDPVRAAKALERYEVDGWVARVDDVFNWHRKVGHDAATDEDTVRVSFVRYV